MAEVIERREPVYVDRDPDRVVVDDHRSGVGTVLLVILAIIVLAILLMRFLPVGGHSSGGTTNVTVPTPTTTKQ